MQNLKKLRTEKGYNQQKLSELLNVSRSTIAMWETDKAEPDNTTLQKLADIFNVSIDYLLGRSDTDSNILNKRIAELLNGCEDYTPLAQKTGVTIANVIQWVKGVSTNCYDKIPEIADYFNVSTDYLLGKTDEPSPTSAPADASSLTDNEQSLITNYRSLDEPQQTNVFNYVSDLAKLNQWNIQKN